MVDYLAGDGKNDYKQHILLSCIVLLTALTWNLLCAILAGFVVYPCE